MRSSRSWRFCPMADASQRGTGARALEDGTTLFRVWAPRVSEMAVEIAGATARTVPMSRSNDGYFEARVANAGHGTDYFLVLDRANKRPDPCSRWQPEGVHGRSRVVADRAFQWTDRDFRGI